MQGLATDCRLLLTVNIFESFVNQHYLYVQGIILYHSYVAENLFRKKETASRLWYSRALSLLLNPATFITKI